MASNIDPEAAGVASRAPAHRRDWRTALILGLVCLVVYNANGRSISAGDAFPARYLPFEIWCHGSVFLDPIATVVAQGNPQQFWMVPGSNGHRISLYPVVLPVLVAPLYLPAVAYLHTHGWTDLRLDLVARVMEKLVASLLTAAAVGLLYLLLRRRAPPWVALLLACAFGFGTTTWVISSQALWQHGLGELLLIGALLLLTGPASSGRALAAGLLCGLLASNRPPDAVLALALGVYGLGWARRSAPLFAAAAAFPPALALAYNLSVAANLAGGYGISGRASFFEHALLPGLAGLLLSPTRGLLVFSPFLLFLPPGLPRELRQSPYRRLELLLCGAAALQILLYAKADWRQGAAWGPRWLTDVLPILVWMLAPIVARLRPLGRWVFAASCIVSIAIEAVGAFWYTGVSDRVILAPAALQSGAAWSPRNAPFLAELRHGPAPRELTLELRGSIDTVEASGAAIRSVAAGTKIDVAGWALAGGRTPLELQLRLDGGPVASTSSFEARPDVRAALGVDSAPGWRLSVATDGLAPGPHVLAAYVRAHANGEPRFLGERRFDVLQSAERLRAPGEKAATSGRTGDADAADLASAGRRAARLIREHQQAPGYWLTSFTHAPRFEQPRLEMNTFVTATMVDLLRPVAAATGLDDVVERARHHLTGQIEPTGLVRYHGLPDAPTIGKLGCAITPDTDDTALVWRIAPAQPASLLPAALEALGHYRTGEGLYRTWLAPRELYQCIDPGRDPNPPDVGIQMHVFLLLARVDPPAARALCGALREAINDERIWVYYKRTPLVPLLRQADLEAAGCAVRVPESRLQSTAPGQDVWVAAGRELARREKPGPKATLDLLRALAADDFAALRRSPPLLYHNDVTASTPRFYWSEDVGYALWLRLYLAHAGRA